MSAVDGDIGLIPLSLMKFVHFLKAESYCFLVEGAHEFSNVSAAFSEIPISCHSFIKLAMLKVKGSQTKLMDVVLPLGQKAKKNYFSTSFYHAHRVEA